MWKDFFSLFSQITSIHTRKLSVTELVLLIPPVVNKVQYFLQFDINNLSLTFLYTHIEYDGEIE